VGGKGKAREDAGWSKPSWDLEFFCTIQEFLKGLDQNSGWSDLCSNRLTL
jgi:hypothetical protein